MASNPSQGEFMPQLFTASVTEPAAVPATRNLGHLGFAAISEFVSPLEILEADAVAEVTEIHWLFMPTSTLL